MGLFTNEKTYNLEPMLTDEQKLAQQLLMQYGQTGNLGSFNAGQTYGGSLGNFQATDTENAAIQRIYELLNSGTPSALATAEQSLTKMADTTFDPSDPSSGYAAYQRQVARATGDANDVINREAAITGNRFGDRILNTKSDLAMQQSDLLASKLAELYNTAQNRSLAASQGLTNLAGMSDQIQQGRIGTAANIGGLQRMLDTAKAQAAYGEWQRARDERLGALGGVSQVWGRDVPYGMKSLTTTQQTPWGQLLNAGLTGIGYGIGGELGGTIGDKISGMFSKAPSQSQILGFDTRMYQ